MTRPAAAARLRPGRRGGPLQRLRPLGPRLPGRRRQRRRQPVPGPLPARGPAHVRAPALGLEQRHGDVGRGLGGARHGLGAVFALVAAAAALNLLCLPVRCPSGCGYFALVDLFLLAACCSRAFSLFYDAYSRQDKLPASGTLLLYELPFPCLTAAFGIVFLLLSMRSRMQLSNSVFQHPCFLAALVLLHFGATLGSVVLLQVFTRLPGLFFVSQGSFVALAAFLSAAYLAFYCYVRADAKHIYHLNNTSPPADRYHRCPFADPKDWNRAAVTAVFAALFALACAALQLYAMLHALGLGGVEVFRPWPWWAFHLSCRVCEAGVCLTLALVVAPPLCCSSSSSSSGGLPQPGLCWPRLSWARGRVDLKSPVLPGSYQWSLSQQEKLVICDAIARRESECLPLYALVDTRLSSLDGLDLLYHSGRLSLGTVADDDDHDPDHDAGSRKPSLDSDSTGDLRPPRPSTCGAASTRRCSARRCSARRSFPGASSPLPPAGLQ
ncbi:hypothetical protein ANANG_G00311390 [Anguilla anguilla]|uniref:Proline-rich transmembrane protein 3/4 domain-containing protein n=1 Tax=Anguilla anguilla TaxID=7936 RepID=A0A9D3LH67_ANGAN|nr:hypothetical protein ANANG_G00311390 [Anguilla anguilla]